MKLFPLELSLHSLRHRQAATIEAIRQAAMEKHKRIMVQAPCSFGKTVLAAHLIAYALAKGNRVLFLVPRLSLINQTVDRFFVQGIADIGVIQGTHTMTDPYAPVQIASVQTLVRRPLPDFDFAIYDEAHIQNAKMNALLDSEAWSNVVVIGLSATPWGKGMGRRWKKLIVGATMHDMIADGECTPIEGWGVPEEFMPDTTDVPTNFDGDYVEGAAEKAMTTPKIIGNAVKTWIEKGPGEKTFMFCVNRSHARKMQKEFEAAGIPCGYIDGTMNADEREAVFVKYRSGEYKILASIDTIGVGVDEDVRCIIYLRLTKSAIKWVQDLGRGVRLAHKKTRLLLLDHAGTAEELGMPTEIHHDHLDMGKERKKGKAFQEEKEPKKPHTCPRCSFLIPPGATVCPECSFSLNNFKGPRVVSGELVPLKTKKGKYPRDVKQDFYSQLIGLAQERGYLQGWVAHRYREKFGVWPKGLQDVPKPPRRTVRNFDHEKKISYMNSKRKEAIQEASK